MPEYIPRARFPQELAQKVLDVESQRPNLVADAITMAGNVGGKYIDTKNKQKQSAIDKEYKIEDDNKAMKREFLISAAKERHEGLTTGKYRVMVDKQNRPVKIDLTDPQDLFEKTEMNPQWLEMYHPKPKAGSVAFDAGEADDATLRNLYTEMINTGVPSIMEQAGRIQRGMKFGAVKLARQQLANFAASEKAGLSVDPGTLAFSDEAAASQKGALTQRKPGVKPPPMHPSLMKKSGEQGKVETGAQGLLGGSVESLKPEEKIKRVKAQAGAILAKYNMATLKAKMKDPKQVGGIMKLLEANSGGDKDVFLELVKIAKAGN